MVTVGALQAGTKDNVIPDDALLKINVRTLRRGRPRHVLDAIARIVNAEAAASGAPQAARDHHHRALPADRQRPGRPRASPPRCAPASATTACTSSPTPVSASEDFGSFGTEWGVPSVFWYVGGTDPDIYARAEQAGRVAQDIPTNHNPRFAPVIHPTLETGVEAMVAAALDALLG